jgi:hypothetical protein
VVAVAGAVSKTRLFRNGNSHLKTITKLKIAPTSINSMRRMKSKPQSTIDDIMVMFIDGQRS